MSELIDTIDRKRLIAELEESNKAHAQNSREQSLLDRNIQIVKNQPKADSKVYAHWKSMPKHHGFEETDELYGEVFQCSNCGETMIGQWNLCPYCGACMDEDTEREDANERKAAIPGSTSCSKRNRHPAVPV